MNYSDYVLSGVGFYTGGRILRMFVSTSFYLLSKDAAAEEGRKKRNYTNRKITKTGTSLTTSLSLNYMTAILRLSPYLL